MTGDLRYVSPQEFAAFAEDETPANVTHCMASIVVSIPAGMKPLVRQTFDEQYPAGVCGLREAFSQSGDWAAG